MDRRPSLQIIGITCRTSNQDGAGARDIPALWQRFYQENIADKIPNKASQEVVALYCDYESDHNGEYAVVIGCPVSTIADVPEGMVAKVTPEGKYQTFTAKGEFPQSLIKTWGEIWSTDLPRTYTGDYEVYGEKFVSGPVPEVDVFIAVK